MTENNNLLNQYKESRQIIRQAMEDHQLVLFIGAGASIASGMPTWKQAIKIIEEKLSIKDKQFDYLRIPQYYYNARGKKEYTQLMRSIFKYGEHLVKHEIHDKIIKFNAATIITTNYDHLIEQAAEDDGQILSIVSKDADLPYRRGDKELIKMHGDFENDNFVLKEDDYLSYSRNFKLIENYVKSLIGTKVVLFIGYSFNDPDLKLIFSWVKDILGGDFQRAYLIESEKTYDTNEAEYFKKFGINLLYTSIQLNDKYTEDLTNNLSLMLDWLLSYDEIDKLTALYNELKPFTTMKHACQKYVKSALFRAGLDTENGRIMIYNTFETSKEDTIFIIKSLVYEQWVRSGKNIILPDDLLIHFVNANCDTEDIVKKQEVNNNRVAEYLKDFKPNSEQEKIKQILNVLCNSSIKYIEIHLPKDNSSRGYPFAIIPLSPQQDPYWMNVINEFDFFTLETIAENNNAQLSNAKPDLYMEQGYIQFILGNYLASYNCYKNAKTIYYKSHEYTRFFVAEFCRYIIGKMISDRRMFLGVDELNIKLVTEELRLINLDRLFSSLPDLGDKNKVLKDIYTFNVAYTLFQDTYKTSEKVIEQANTQYLMFAGNAAFTDMREKMLDYYKYISLNLLPVNNYLEHISIFRIYFQSIINSVITTIDPDPINNNVKNIHENELEKFDILIALKFIGVNDLKKMFKGFHTNFSLSNNALEYLKKVVGNCKKRKVKGCFENNIIFWKCITFLGHCNLSESIIEIVLQKLIELIEIYNYREYSNDIVKFINNSHDQKLLSDKLLDLINIFLSKELHQLSNNKLECNFNYNLLPALLRVMKENKKKFDNVECIMPLINDDSRLLCVSIYQFLGKQSQKAIYSAYHNWKFEKENFRFDFYYNLVITNIIKPNFDAEKHIIEYLNRESVDESNFQNKGIAILPTYDNCKSIYNLFNLYLCDLIIDKKSVEKLIREKNIIGADWIIDYKNFDYESFDINWLGICSDNLLENICKNDDVKIKIKTKIEEEYEKGNVNQKIVDIYFKYFAKENMNR